MKKIYNYDKKYYCPELYREDLEQIQDVIKTLNPSYLRISGSDFETEDIKEIPVDKITKDFNFYAPPLVIRFNEWRSYLTNSSDDLLTLGAVSKINSIIKKRENLSRYYLSKINYFFQLICIFIIFFRAEIFKDKITLGIFTFGQLLSCFCVWYYIFFYKNSKTNLDYFKNKKENFFHRNKENIANQIIGAVIGAVIAVVMTKLIN
ncbi:MAG: hypothetical protein QG583_448 [Patescibacteria group bacterium]|nr:hypothetical protein [Patescibacteria group bacterium]